MSNTRDLNIKIVLQPEQEKILSLPKRGAVLVKGVAGSGKTTIALYRAMYLMNNFDSLFGHQRTAIFTFNRLLSNYIEHISLNIVKEVSNPTHNSLSANITTFHKWAYHFMQNNGDDRCLCTLKNNEKIKIIKSILKENSKWTISSKSLRFLSDEIAWIKGKIILSLQEYQSVNRIGRGTSERITQKQREEVWEFYETYNTTLAKRNVIDFDDYARICLNIINKDPDFIPPFTHIVIDEAQDLTKAQLMTIKHLVCSETESITVIADSAQRIYSSGFTWAEAGFTFKGSTCVLKRNYRGTINISRAALSLLDNDPQKAEFTQIESARRGEHIPVIYRGRSFNEQWSFLQSLLPELLNKYQSIVILRKNKKYVEDFANLLFLNKYHPQILSKDKDFSKSTKGLFLCTQRTAKGLEFDVVFILDCNSFPIKNSLTESETDQEYISTERRNLFTSMTRAREELYLISSKKKPSMLLDEIDSELVENIFPE